MDFAARPSGSRCDWLSATMPVRPPAWHGWMAFWFITKQHKQHRGMRLHGRILSFLCCQQICIPTSRPKAKAYPARCVSPWAFVDFSGERET